MARRPSIPIACTLGSADAAAQAEEWVALRAEALESTAIAGGRRLVLPARLAQQVQDLARREASCCAFLDLAVSVDDATVSVAITSPDPQAMPVIELLAGG